MTLSIPIKALVHANERSAITTMASTLQERLAQAAGEPAAVTCSFAESFSDLQTPHEPAIIITSLLLETDNYQEDWAEVEERLRARYAALAEDAASIVFEDVSRYSRMQQELEGNRRDLELAYEELQSTIDELETTNEELQSANEELQTTNEELQSTNEELETMNEELQSTNEELETINDELRERTSELNQVNEFLEAILTSIGVGIAVLDPQQRVQIWNGRAEDLWGMRADEAIDHHFLSLDIGLPSEQLAPALRAVLSGASEREQAELEAINRRGRPIVCTATVLRLQSPGADNGKGVRGAIVMMEDRPPAEGDA